MAWAGKIPSQAGFEPRIFRSLGQRCGHSPSLILIVFMCQVFAHLGHERQDLESTRDGLQAFTDWTRTLIRRSWGQPPHWRSSYRHGSWAGITSHFQMTSALCERQKATFFFFFFFSFFSSFFFYVPQLDLIFGWDFCVCDLLLLLLLLLLFQPLR